MLGRRRRPQEDFSREVESHLQLEEERLVAEGLDPAEARAAARRAFGNVTLARERFYESGRLLWLDHLLRDLRFALRALGRNRGFAITAIVTLAAGIGVSTAVFSFVKPLLLQPLPGRESNLVVRLYASNPAQNAVREGRFSLAHMLEVQKQSQVFEQVVAVYPLSITLTGDGEAELVMGWWVSPGFCATLGVQPMIGRDFLPEEERPKGSNAVLLYYSLWQRRYGGATDLIGKRITIDGEPCTVGGILPPGFRFGHRTSEILLPLQADFNRSSGNYGSRWIFIYARLARGITVAQAQAEVDVIARRLEQEHPKGNQGWSIQVISWQQDMIGQFRTALLALLVASGLLLAITCANVAGLSLARTAAREKEIAVRCAPGAGWRAVVRVVLTESFLLAGFGALAGLPLAIAGVRFLKAALPDPYGRGTNLVMLDFIGIDLWVLAFVVSLTLLVALLVGLPAAWHAARPNLNEALKDVGTTAAAAFRSRRTHSLLVVGEVAIVLVLVTGAGLMVQSLIRLSRTDPGFRPDHVLTVRPVLPSSKYNRVREAAFYAELVQRIERFPQVVSVARTSTLPIAGWDYWAEFHIPGRSFLPGKMPWVISPVVTTAYFQTLGIPLRAGRLFNELDRPGRPAVAVIDQETARQYFSGEDPVGKQIELGKEGGPTYEIVGVVGSILDNGLDKPPQPVLYFPEEQSRGGAVALMIRTTTDPMRLLPLVRAEVRRLEPDAALFRVHTTRRLLDVIVWQGRLATYIVSGLAGLALLLAAVGLYGLMQYRVTCQRREIAIRMALGAERGDVLRRWVGRGLLLTIAGMAIGVPASLALTRFISGQLYGIQPTDPATYAGVCLVLVITAILGSYVPARRAAGLDPTTALRNE